MVHTGSSGGGFAALHMAALLPRSEAVAFNAQTSIHAYLAGGTSYSAQRMFIRCVLPDLFDSIPTDATLRKDWTHVLGERASCFARFEGSEAKGRVTMVQNVDEFHYVDHYLPFVKHMTMLGHATDTVLVEYSGGHVHGPPTPAVFTEVLDGVLAETITSGWLPSSPTRTPQVFKEPLWLMRHAFDAV